MFGFCLGYNPEKKQPICQYICKRCGEILHIDDVIKHIITDHDSDWRGNFCEALDEYDRKIVFRRKKS